MQTKRLCVLIRILAGVGGAPLGRFGPSGEVFCWRFRGGASFCGSFVCFFVSCLLCICVRLFVCALWSPAGGGGGGGSWLSFDVSNCKFVTFPLVSWVRCDT